MANRSTHGSRYQLAAIVLSIGLVASACGDDDSGDTGASPPASGSDSTGAPSTTAERPDEGTPEAGGEITYALSVESSGGYCLPEAQLGLSGIQVARSVFDTLTAPNADGEIEPYLAESVEPNDDFTTWTITLPENIVFHDGSPLDAQIVADNINAWRGQYEARNSTLLPIVYADVQDVKVTGKLTVEVTTTRPWASFPWHLWGESRLGIIGRAQLDGDTSTCANEPIGTGPFSVQEWTVNQELVAVKNPDYWQTDTDGNQLPYLDQITYTPIPEMNQRINALESGQADVIIDVWGDQLVNRLRPMGDSDSVQIFETDRIVGNSLALFNHAAPPFDSKHARLAVSHAFDKELFNEVINAGAGVIGNGPFVEGQIGYLEDNGAPEFDLDKAKDELEAYEQETGDKLAFTYSFDATAETTKVAQELQTQMAAAGIDVKLDPVGDNATLINEVLAGNFQVVPWGVYAGGDPDGYRHWYYSESPFNVGRISDPQLDRLWDEGREAAQGRPQIYEQINQRFASEAYHLWFGGGSTVIAAGSDVHGVIDPDVTGEWGYVAAHFAQNLWMST